MHPVFVFAKSGNWRSAQPRYPKNQSGTEIPVVAVGLAPETLPRWRPWEGHGAVGKVTRQHRDAPHLRPCPYEAHVEFYIVQEPHFKKGKESGEINFNV